jgi:hypothetical protein
MEERSRIYCDTAVFGRLAPWTDGKYAGSAVDEAAAAKKVDTGKVIAEAAGTTPQWQREFARERVCVVRTPAVITSEGKQIPARDKGAVDRAMKVVVEKETRTAHAREIDTLLFARRSVLPGHFIFFTTDAYAWSVVPKLPLALGLVKSIRFYETGQVRGIGDDQAADSGKEPPAAHPQDALQVCSCMRASCFVILANRFSFYTNQVQVFYTPQRTPGWKKVVFRPAVMLDRDADAAGAGRGAVFEKVVPRCEVKVAGVVTMPTLANKGEFRAKNRMDPVAPSVVPAAAPLLTVVTSAESMQKAWHLRLDPHVGTLLERLKGVRARVVCVSVWLPCLLPLLASNRGRGCM